MAEKRCPPQDAPCTHHYILDANNHGICWHCLAERDWPRLEPPYQWRDLDDAFWTATRRER